MSALSLSRLRRLTRHELSWRSRQAARRTVQRVVVRARPPRWKRADLQGVLGDGVLEHILPVHDAHPQWQAVHRELARLIRARTSRFTLDPATAAGMRGEVLARWPDAAAEAAARADQIIAGRYELLGYRGLEWRTPGQPLDWHRDPVHRRDAPRAFWADVPYLDPAVGDHKVIWELNRHQHWLQLGRALWLTGDERYRRELVDQLGAWLAANPPLVGINWASMLEIGVRSMSWVWALHFLLGIGDQGSGVPDPHSPWLVDMLVALDKQLTHVEHNLSLYFSPNTHLTGEALALYVVGVALPELAGSPRWAETGRRILFAEIDRQIHPDGGHAERSTHYQRYTLDFYLLALLTAQRDHDTEATARFTDAVRRLAEFTRAMADDSGQLPLIGDDDGGMLWPMTGRACHDVRDSLALAAVLLEQPDLAPWGIQEEAFWIAGPLVCKGAEERVPQTVAAPARSRTFRQTGYVAIRDSSGSHAVLDVGRHGYLNGGHAHADALALTLTLDGRPFLIDPGTFTYTMDPRLRDQFRSSMSHNTLTLGHRSQSTPAGPFQWQTRADATLHAQRHNHGFDWAEASHDGYPGTRHRRTLLRTAHSGWLILDEILTHGRVAADAHWHFDPAWSLRCDAPGRLLATHVDGSEAWLLHDAGGVFLAHGDDKTGLGWYAPTYGSLVPTWTARTTRDADAPFTMLTWIAGRRPESAASPCLERLIAACDITTGVVGARLVDGDRTSVFLLRPGEASSRDGRGCGILDYQTDARLLHYVTDAGRLLALDLVDASHVLALRDEWLSVAAGGPIVDLHVTLADGVLDLHATTLPRELRLQGGAIAGVQRLRLNDREIVPATVRADTIEIAANDWAAPPPSPTARPPVAALIPIAAT